MINRACYFYDYQSTDYCMMHKQNIEDCPDKCKFFEIVSASPVFLNRMDILFRNAKNIQPEDGFEDIAVHATALYFISKNADNKEINISPEEFAEILKIQYKDRDSIPNLRLIACLSGSLENGAAQKLANILKVNVKAPIGAVIVDFSGNMYVEEPITHKKLYDNGWKIFYPKED